MKRRFFRVFAHLAVAALLLALARASTTADDATPASTNDATYAITVLPDLGSNAAALDINASGDIVGWTEDPVTGAILPAQWDARRLVLLDTGRSDGGTAFAINDAGQSAGILSLDTGSSAPATWIDGKAHLLETPDGPGGAAFGLNNAGTVVGHVETPSGAVQAVAWDEGAVTPLPSLGGAISSAIGINRAGSIVGYAENDVGDVRAVLWEGVTVTDLGTLGGAESIAVAINDAGQITGWATTATSIAGDPYAGNAFLWEDGVMTDLGTWSGDWSWGLHINTAGCVCGLSPLMNGIERAVLWEDGKMIDLEAYGSHSEATAINDDGIIVGWAVTPEGRSVAVLWARPSPAAIVRAHQRAFLRPLQVTPPEARARLAAPRPPNCA